MPDTKIARKLKLRRKSKVLLFLALILCLWLGYQLADVERRYYQTTIDNLRQTISNLNEQNHMVTQDFNQESARLSVCQAKQPVVQKELTEIAQALAVCEDKVALYQHVMAPELAGNMLSVDMVSLQPAQAANSYSLSMILLQPRLRKAVISGNLSISVMYPDDAEPVKINDLAYRFKFFQQVETTLTLPDDKTPAFLLFQSDVVQYKRVRETLNQQIPWKVMAMAEPDNNG